MEDEGERLDLVVVVEHHYPLFELASRRLDVDLGAAVVHRIAESDSFVGIVACLVKTDGKDSGDGGQKRVAVGHLFRLGCPLVGLLFQVIQSTF